MTRSYLKWDTHSYLGHRDKTPSGSQSLAVYRTVYLRNCFLRPSCTLSSTRKRVDFHMVYLCEFGCIAALRRMDDHQIGHECRISRYCSSLDPKGSQSESVSPLFRRSWHATNVFLANKYTGLSTSCIFCISSKCRFVPAQQNVIWIFGCFEKMQCVVH